MPYNAVEKTLEAHKPQTPAGFAERSDAQVLQLFAEGKKKGSLKRKFTVVLCGLLLMLSLTTALAATVPGVNAALYKYWPQAAEALMPINAGCEDQGIRMEVESAVIKGDDVLIKYSLQDLEGDRINAFTTAFIDDDALFNTDWNYPERISSLLLNYDEKTKTAYLVENASYGYHVTKPDDHPITIRLSTIIPAEATDLHPLLKKYGGAAESMPLPEKAYALTATPVAPAAEEVPEQERREMKVLDPSKGPDLEINEYVRLSGIGWIDGKLHVQLHYPDLHMQEVGNKHMYEYYPISATVTVPTPLDYDISDGCGVLKRMTHVFWTKPDEDIIEYEECIYDCDPAELDLAEFYLHIRRYDRMIEGNWEVTVPYRMINYQ